MIKEIIEFLKDKKIAILGFGLEGKSTYNFIRKNLPSKCVDILLKNEPKGDIDFINARTDRFINFIIGENYLETLENYDVIIKSPGISFKDIDISKISKKIYSQLELFLEYSKNFIIGITGTKGKSTTSSLIYEMIKKQGKDVKLLGNIGVPIFEGIEEIKGNTIIVLELSSHALQYVRKSPNISVMLNLFSEHLDHYESFEEYGNAKFNIFKFQHEQDTAIFNLENENMNNKKYHYKKSDYAITINNKSNTVTDNTIYVKDEYVYCNDKKLYNVNNTRKLKGNHNLNNIMFVLAVGKVLNLDLEKTIDTINNFNPLEHRLEYVGTFNNIEYYNDSIATIPEATIESIKALKNVNTLIVGGTDRGVSQEKLISFLKESQVENIICLPKTGECIYDKLKKYKKNTISVKNLREAVNKAKKLTKKNMICLLSPAAASYGYFKNFEERGNIFKKFVKED